MNRQELFEAVQEAAKGDHQLSMYYIPVTIMGSSGMLNPVELLDNLVTFGEVTENTTFGVSFEDGSEDWYPLYEIKRNGKAQPL